MKKIQPMKMTRKEKDSANEKDKKNFPIKKRKMMVRTNLKNNNS